MADYNIYIHSMEEGNAAFNGGSSNFNFTTPWGDTNEDSQRQFGVKDLKQMSPSNIAGTVKGAIKSGGWAGAVIAAAVIVVKTGLNVLRTCNEFAELGTGDFRGSLMYQNFQKGMNAIFHPISNFIDYRRIVYTEQIDNERKAMERQLLGDSEINSYTNKGY